MGYPKAFECSGTMYREWETWEHLVLNGTSSLNPSSQDSGNYAEEAVKRLEDPEGMDGIIEAVSSRTHHCTHEHTETLAVCTGPAHSKLDRVSVLRGEVHTSSQP